MSTVNRLLSDYVERRVNRDEFIYKASPDDAPKVIRLNLKAFESKSLVRIVSK